MATGTLLVGASERAASPPVRALVVDDEAPMLQLIAIRLEQKGFVCDLASSLQEASDAINRDSFDVVVSDMRMPGGSGLELHARIQALGSHTPLILLTGLDDVRMAAEAFRAGVSDYVLKPVDAEQLTASIYRAVENSRLKRELEQHRLHLEEMVRERTSALEHTLTKLHSTYNSTIEALGTALEYRDYETQGHSRRVAVMCRQIAVSLKVQEPELTTITYGAFLHDIGKIAIPDAVLRKPGPLSPEEQALMRSHVEVGFKMLQPIPFLREAAEIVLAHHEAFDGSGYPRGLRGNQIILGARIFAVADTVDAITQDRPYRKAQPMEAARREILRCSGTQFDPRVVEAFLGLPQAAGEPCSRNTNGNSGGQFSS